MKITKKGEYALRTLLVLASVYEQKKTLTLHEIANKENLPEKFLEQIMMPLRRARLVHGEKGKHGGYVLSRSPKDITLGEVIRVIDGPLAPLLSGSEIERRIKNHDRHASLYMVFLDVRNAISEILDKKTLADVLEKSLELAWSNQSHQMYYI